ncbi:MAG: hypothetical protein KAH38_08015 [Candidatus Hydrogenedentes bacterium]|nr:hypothetical protein [Candidatus Hydrogenedentota bacterium]
MPLFVADAVYLSLVYAFFILLPPLGRDYAALARPDSILFFGGMVQLFGGYSWAYLLLNLLLLYGCMALILSITKEVTKGPWWLGSVAAVLFMANPVKTEAVLNISGVRELWPGFMALLTLFVYIQCRRSTKRGMRGLPLLTYLVAILTGPINIMLFAVIAILEFTVYKKRSRCWIPLALVGSAALFISGQWAEIGALHLSCMFTPLFFVVYPIGILPDTVAFFQQWPLAGYGIAIAAVGIGIGLIRKVNHPAFTFGLLGAVAFRLCQGGFAVDPITLNGGGQLLVPIALISIAAAGFFHAVIEKSHWRRSVVRFTTLLCIAVMCCQIWVNLHWRYAGQEVERFQQAVVSVTKNYPGKPVAVAPDIQYYRTAPMMLSESVRYTTPFSKAQPIVPLLPFSVIPPVKIVVEDYSPHAIALSVQGLAAPEINTLPLFSRAWWLHRHDPRKAVPMCLEAEEFPFPGTLIRVYLQE